jgi:hypothetical protein
LIFDLVRWLRDRKKPTGGCLGGGEETDALPEEQVSPED